MVFISQNIPILSELPLAPLLVWARSSTQYVSEPLDRSTNGKIWKSYIKKLKDGHTECGCSNMEVTQSSLLVIVHN